MPICKIFLLTRSHIPGNQLPIFGSWASAGWLGWHMASCKQEDFANWHFFIIFMIYFNILSSKVLVHWIQPNALFERGVQNNVSCGPYHVEWNLYCYSIFLLFPVWTQSPFALLFKRKGSLKKSAMHSGQFLWGPS